MTNTEDMGCAQIRQHLALHAGGDLEEAGAAMVERHLANCAACKAELAVARASRERIGALGAETSRAVEAHELWPAVRARLGAPGASSAQSAASATGAPMATGTASATRATGAAREERELSAAPAPRARRAAARTWFPVSLAAAAALVAALVWRELPGPASAPPNPLGGPATELVRDTLPAEEPASIAGGPDVSGAPGGTLRRAQPGDERLRDSSVPFARDGRPRTHRDTPNSLADYDLR